MSPLQRLNCCLSQPRSRCCSQQLFCLPPIAPCTVFAARCPLGQECSKKGSLIARKVSEDECKNAIKHHLKTSAYHELSDDTAQILIDELEVETWEDDDDNWKWKEDEDHPSWYDNRKKRKTQQHVQHRSSSAGSASASPMLPIGAGAAGHLHMHGQLQVAKTRMPEPEYVQVSKIQQQASSSIFKNYSSNSNLMVFWLGG